MKVLPINNTIPNNTFKAKLSAKEINGLLKEIDGYDAALVPKLYTLLEYLKELSGKKAKFTNEYKNNYVLKISNKPVNENIFVNGYSALYSSLVDHKDTIVKKSSVIRMPEIVFEQKWWSNRFKTKKDIRQLNDK